MTVPEQPPVISAEERGETSVHRTVVTRTVMVLLTVALAVGIVVASNLVGRVPLPWSDPGADAGAPTPRASASPAPSPQASDAAESESLLLDVLKGTGVMPTATPTPTSAAGGETWQEDGAERIRASEEEMIAKLTDAAIGDMIRAGWDNPLLKKMGIVVLDPRAEPYGLTDLVALRALRAMGDDTYDLAQSVVVRAGATLKVDAPGRTIRILSTKTGFSQIIGWGGNIVLNGSEKKPLRVTSWDTATDAPDADLSDGRGYVLARNGTLSAAYTQFSDLGFWSGRTGGVAVVATEPGLARATFVDTTHTRLAFGVYLSGVLGATIDGMTVDAPLMSGITVTGGSAVVRIADAVVGDAGGDGIVVNRETSSVAIVDTTVSHADGVGVRIAGAPRATGPNAGGASTYVMADFLLEGVTALDNRTGGVLIDGGNGVTVKDLTTNGVAGGLRIVGPAHTVEVTDSTLVSTGGIPLRLEGDVGDATVTTSRMKGPVTGVELRGVRVELRGNTITVGEGQGVSVSDDAHLVLSANRIRGLGETPVRAEDGASVTQRFVDTSAWSYRPALLLWLNHHPMGWLWLLVLLIPAVGLPFAIVRRRRRAELRGLLEDAIVQYGRRQIELYGPDASASVVEEDREPVLVAAAPQAHPHPTTAQPVVARAPVPEIGAPITINGVPVSEWPETPHRGHRPVTPRSLRDLREVLPAQAFTSPQQFAVAAVLEAGYPVFDVARLFRVPAWRLESWVEETLAAPPARAAVRRR
ncbi:right-handed parallel beta-helix repeat-containing protein [Microbacterium oleivorans]|uniref:right-handed parallel beta-helix repeat-containing protein n=1 Tax=Microbacterium oleivorans TaxID=273677 RepID=UPI0020422F25|nr:right-handed parallel beta-helix repeat-containing protein [Microbacterium oleivorans]MCM3697188.1 right-handed parallel beta-helix repeat-containing protein [Microbacterium oleivorans]